MSYVASSITAATNTNTHATTSRPAPRDTHITSPRGGATRPKVTAWSHAAADSVGSPMHAMWELTQKSKHSGISRNTPGFSASSSQRGKLSRQKYTLNASVHSVVTSPGNSMLHNPMRLSCAACSSSSYTNGFSTRMHASYATG
eukprot:CAMPEP_0197579936 /NCGR_PEP_ID=MMETSP1326-20131121/3843_1 /TAXON_ID=1155430 /ORGANISM="Genus nov. species nov., Strain RCC2288" /LENGTH=143 /DNA_ID=CAMNT_0043143541 /DNA_START=164 /DNA_END=595 /DNA_ORIENTATION=+